MIKDKPLYQITKFKEFAQWQFRLGNVNEAFCCHTLTENGCHFHSHMGVCQSPVGAVAHQPTLVPLSSMTLGRLELGLVRSDI